MYRLPTLFVVLVSVAKNVYVVPPMEDVKALYLSSVKVLGKPEGLVTAMSRLATDPRADVGVYPKCLAIETADDQ